MIELLTVGALTTIQDRGRQGCLRWGVGTAGAMDSMALTAGNILLGNDENCAAIEVQIFPFRVRFKEACAFAITGADCGAKLDAQALMPWSVRLAQAGQELQLGTPLSGPVRASRAYLCLAGGVDVPIVLNSRSTQLRGAFGGLEGRALRRGDTLRTGTPSNKPGPSGFGLLPPQIAMPLQRDGCPAVRVLPAAEYDGYSKASQATFWNHEWKITPQSDRYGYRLAGEALQPIAPMEMRSHGIVPGVIQVPPDGQPIVQMRDAQPTGGYPKVGTVIEADLWRLGQTPIGSRIRFIEATWKEAMEALDEQRAWLGDVARQVALYQNMKGSA